MIETAARMWTASWWMLAIERTKQTGKRKNMWVKLKRTKSPIHHKQRWLRIKGIVKYPLQFKELQFLARDLLSKLYIHTHGSHYYDYFIALPRLLREAEGFERRGGLEVVVLFFIIFFSIVNTRKKCCCWGKILPSS